MMDTPSMTPTDLSRATLAARLRELLDPALAAADLALLADTGLAHDHVRIGDSGLLARVPKQSQMQLGAADNLAYQAACFGRASLGGHAPRLHGVLAPSATLPRGALLVDFIAGRAARLPGDLPAIMAALASFHALPLPEIRAPLQDAGDPLAALVEEVETQGRYLDAAALDPAARAGIDAELAALRQTVTARERPPRLLISFDAHPGNFIIRDDGSAVLVDLEKARYSYPPLDLAHATLYTSTTWDVASYAELDVAEIRAAYGVWRAALGPDGDVFRPWLVPLRRAMWLWSVTWCAKWRVLSARDASATAEGEDWSANHSVDALIAHVRDRVDCYLSPAVIARVRDEFAALTEE